MKCLYCGKLITAEDTFCGYCGKNIQELKNEEQFQNEKLKEEMKLNRLEKEKVQFSRDIIIETEGNKFKAIKEFCLKYSVDNDTAFNYINMAYDKINNADKNSINNVEEVIYDKKDANTYVNPKGIKKTIIVASSSVKKATSAIGRGILGAAILGPIGLLAGTTAKTKDTTTFQLIYNNGQQETITVKNSSWMFKEYCRYLDN